MDRPAFSEEEEEEEVVRNYVDFGGFQSFLFFTKIQRKTCTSSSTECIESTAKDNTVLFIMRVLLSYI